MLYTWVIGILSLFGFGYGSSKLVKGMGVCGIKLTGIGVSGLC